MYKEKYNTGTNNNLNENIMESKKILTHYGFNNPTMRNIRQF